MRERESEREREERRGGVLIVSFSVVKIKINFLFNAQRPDRHSLNS